MARTTQSVVTWQTPDGRRLSICRDCERRLDEQGVWPHDGHGTPYYQVVIGETRGDCEVCAWGDNAPEHLNIW